jgi:hypothetical protein
MENDTKPLLAGVRSELTEMAGQVRRIGERLDQIAARLEGESVPDGPLDAATAVRVNQLAKKLSHALDPNKGKE